MRQVAITRHGPPEVLEVRHAEDPVPGPGQVRIRVRAAGINFADVLARLGLYPDAPPLPAVVGCEVAGLVDETGLDVTAITPGDRVTALVRFGGYADCVVCPVEQVFPTPARLSDAEAAAIPVNYLTAVLALYRLANITAGETVLIHNAGGGVGIAAVQLAQIRRARVIGTASGGKHAALRDFGVDQLIDYRNANVEEEVRTLTRGRGVDVILDPLGGRSFAASYRMLAPLGRLVLYGMSAAAPATERKLLKALRAWWQLPSFNPLSLLNKNRAVLGLHLGHLWSEHRRIAPLMELLLEEFRSGRLKPVIARAFPLEQAAEAHAFLQARSNIGKVVLVM
ncbi:MAG: synaptic vesicle VAT-1 family membrane protein [Acidobacteriota bacterium]